MDFSRRNGHPYQRRIGLHAAVLALAALISACGAPSSESADSASAHRSITGKWQAALPHADGRLELHEDDSELKGVLGIDEFVWPVTGISTSAHSFVLVLLPSRHEEPLMAALGFTTAAAPAFLPLHAADKVTFYGKAADDFNTAQGTAISRFGDEAPFTLTR